MSTTTDQQHEQQPEQQPEQPGEQQHDEQQQGGGRDAGAEAARYRRQARDAEAARDALQARVDAADRADVLRLAAEKMSDPADLMLIHNLDDFRGENGTIDAEKVTKAVQDVIADHPHWGLAQEPAGNRRPRPREFPEGWHRQSRPTPIGGVENSDKGAGRFFR